MAIFRLLGITSVPYNKICQNLWQLERQKSWKYLLVHGILYCHIGIDVQIWTQIITKHLSLPKTHLFAWGYRSMFPCEYTFQVAHLTSMGNFQASYPWMHRSISLSRRPCLCPREMTVYGAASCQIYDSRWDRAAEFSSFYTYHCLHPCMDQRTHLNIITEHLSFPKYIKIVLLDGCTGLCVLVYDPSKAKRTFIYHLANLLQAYFLISKKLWKKSPLVAFFL